MIPRYSSITDLRLLNGFIQFPVFLPDATRGVVRAVDAQDLFQCGVQALVMNTFHLMQHPGSTTVQQLGGLHKMSGWPLPIITDSGGFQAYSLIRDNPKIGNISAKGIAFRGEGAGRKIRLTPEKSVQLQMSYGADVVICLDECTHSNESQQKQQEAVIRTIEWARLGKNEFERLVEQKKLGSESRPKLFAVIQGGGSHDLRRRCAEELLAIGFDGFGFGGWPLDEHGALLADIIAFTRELIPAHIPMHALGVGHPQNVVDCFRCGYDLFDSALPTRDARRGRLYAFQANPLSSAELGEDWFSYVYIQDDRYIKMAEPISLLCDCLACNRYSAGYLHHLYKLGDSLFPRLATIHNLRFMMQLEKKLRMERLAA